MYRFSEAIGYWQKKHQYDIPYIINNINIKNNNKQRCHYYTYGLTTTPDQISNNTVWEHLYLYIIAMNNKNDELI